MLFRSLNFTLNAGDAMLIAGPNGSGKSSLLRMLAGLLRSAEGEIIWGSQPIMADLPNYQTQIHWLGHDNALKPELSVCEMLGYWQALLGGKPFVDSSAASFRKIFSALRRKKIVRNDVTSNILAQLGLDTLADQPIRTLSAGQKRRLGLARLLLEFRPLWLLDEPLTALDAAHQNILSEMVAAHRAAGGMVIMASHQVVAWPALQTLTLEGA